MVREHMTEVLIAKARLRAETDALVVSWNGEIRRLKPGKHYTERKRGGFVADRSTIRMGEPVRAGIRYTHDTTSRLIAAR